MVANFFKDLERAKTAEVLVKDVLSSMTDDYTFESVGDQRQYYHKGDIKVTDKNGNEHFIEVKDDTCISKTGNVLCEEEVFYDSIGDYVPGFMTYDYEIFCVASRDANKLYIIDFEVLKRLYRKCPKKDLHHPGQMSICSFVPVAMIRKEGGMIAEIDY